MANPSHLYQRKHQGPTSGFSIKQTRPVYSIWTLHLKFKHAHEWLSTNFPHCYFHPSLAERGQFWFWAGGFKGNSSISSSSIQKGWTSYTKLPATFCIMVHLWFTSCPQISQILVGALLSQSDFQKQWCFQVYMTLLMLSKEKSLTFKVISNSTSSQKTPWRVSLYFSFYTIFWFHSGWNVYYYSVFQTISLTATASDLFISTKLPNCCFRL